uniref:opioid growth factor receptor-like n=1 Tax=Semicossyphus pulcher TaxID=241346 RepID=UPI0037E89BB1
MACFGFNRLSRAALDWFWRTLYFLLRWIQPALRPLAGYTTSAIGWLKGQRSSRDEPEISEKLPEGFLPEVDEESNHEGQHEAQERPAALDVEPVDEAPGCNEEHEDEFDRKEYRVEATDELFCEYDSTWELPEEPEECTWRSPTSTSHKFRRFESASKDMQNYRHDYPSQTRFRRWNNPVSDARPNYKFYTGSKPSEPDGVYINKFHDDWAEMYDKLERVHSYIQWLFPLPEPGMNYEATPLTREEIEEFLTCSTAKENLLKSYKLMLNFYGIKLCNEMTGEVERASNWRDRFNNLNRNTHNNLRITRILKCLGILGFPHYQVPLVHFFLKETLVHGELPNVQDSVLNYFLFAVRDKVQRRSLIKFAYMNYDREDEFVWCPKKLQMMWSRQRSESEPQRGLN